MCWSLACLFFISQISLLSSVSQIFVTADFWLHSANYGHWWVWKGINQDISPPLILRSITLLAMTVPILVLASDRKPLSHRSRLPNSRFNAHETRLPSCSGCTTPSYCPFGPRDSWCLPAVANICCGAS